MIFFLPARFVFLDHPSEVWKVDASGCFWFTGRNKQKGCVGEKDFCCGQWLRS